MSPTAPIATDLCSLPPGMPRIVAAQNDILTDDSGRRIVDLFSGNGAALLGHANPRISAALKLQLDSIWLTGGLPTPALDAAQTALESCVPATHRLVGLYSTGMEAAEFALRLARTHTGRTGFIGFSHAMHGKSAATAPLGWDNAPSLPHILRLPSFADISVFAFLEPLANQLQSRSVAAVFLEPVLGTGGGHAAPAATIARLIALCNEHGTLVVCDEILTGFHRTGPRFVFESLPVLPDVILLGKALANGFPASAVIARRNIPCTPSMLPGSTYSGNPLAAAAITATLQEIARHDLPALVAAISQTVTAILGDMPSTTLRGRGALWMLELNPPFDAATIAKALFARGVFASYTANYLRILPAATITPAHLHQACRQIRDLLCEACHA